MLERYVNDEFRAGDKDFSSGKKTLAFFFPEKDKKYLYFLQAIPFVHFTIARHS